VTPYRQKGRKAWKTRVRHPDGRAKVVRLRHGIAGDGPRDGALDRPLYNDRTPTALAALDAIVAGRVTLPRAYDRRHDLTAFLAGVDDVDLEPMVERWLSDKRKSRRGAGSAEKYLDAGPALIPLGVRPFSRSNGLRGATIDDAPPRPRRARPDAQPAQGGVLELRQVARDAKHVLEANPVREIEGWGEGDGRLVYYEREQAQGADRGARAALRRDRRADGGPGSSGRRSNACACVTSNLTPDDGQAHGGKTRWRNRLCRIVEAWCVDYIRPALAGKLPDALVFDGVKEWWALREHKAAAEAKGLPKSTLHDWRHTHAVLMLRAGYKPTVVAHQLGHRDTSLVWKRYGRFLVDSRDYLLPAVRTHAKENIT
jgi:hypothetical protein